MSRENEGKKNIQNSAEAAAQRKKTWKLVTTLARNDFRTRFAGSYLGIVWAFVQPIVTIFVYWFVFSTLRAHAVREVPFVLWLIAGLVPWFYFQESLNSGTNSLIEYSYLVSTVVSTIDLSQVLELSTVL